MSDTKKKSSWIWTLSKITFFVAAFLLIIFTVLANMGGKSDTLKGIIEEYASESTGYDARIETLNELRFFPTVRIDISDMKFYERSENTEEGDQRPEPVGDPVATVDHAKLAAGFWDVAFATGQIKDILIENFAAQPGAFAEKAINVQSLKIEKPKTDDGTPQVIGNGSYGSDPFSLSANLKKDGENYSLATDQGVELSMGPIRATGNLEGLGDFKITDLKVYDTESDNRFVFGGEIEIDREEDQQFDVTADLNVSDEGTSHLNLDIELDLESEPMRITGDVTSNQFHLDDFMEGAALIDFINHVQDFLDRQKPQATTQPETKEGLDLSFALMDLDVDLKEILIDGAPLASWSGHVTIQDSVLKAETKSGQFSSGDLKTTVTINTAVSPNEFLSNLNITKMDVGELQEVVMGDASHSGVGDIRWNLKSAGQTLDDFKSNMNGQFAMLLSESDIESGFLNLWGGGLVNALIPSFGAEEELGLNCGVADFKVEDGTAKSRAVFFDFDRLTLKAEGNYNIATDELDLKIKPEPKTTAIGDISTAVTVSGPLGDPSFSPSVLDLGIKIGSLVLSAANPVALAFTMTDLGLNENHPCSKYIQEDGSLVQDMPENTGGDNNGLLPGLPF